MGGKEGEEGEGFMKLKYKFTPGPWIVESNQAGGIDSSVYALTPIHKNPRYICRVYGPGALSPDVAERDANARLIASALELLDVAQRWVACLNHLAKNNPDKNYRSLLNTTIMNDMSNAITKATGDRDD